jgi:hypothetical protein
LIGAAETEDSFDNVHLTFGGGGTVRPSFARCHASKRALSGQPARFAAGINFRSSRGCRCQSDYLDGGDLTKAATPLKVKNGATEQAAKLRI